MRLPLAWSVDVEIRRSEVILNERQWCKHFDIFLFGLHDFHFFGALWSALAIRHREAQQLGILLFLVILLDALQKGLIATRLLDVLDAHVNALLELAISNDLRHFHTERIPVHVEDNPSLPMVERVGHAFVDRAIYND